MATQQTTRSGVRKHSSGIGVAAFGGGIEFAIRKMDGESTSKAAGHAALEALKWYAFAPIMEVKMGLDFIGAGMDMLGVPTPIKMMELGKKNLERLTTNPGEARFGSRNFQETEQSHTLRQRNMQAIQESRLNARSVLGNEARMLHR